MTDEKILRIFADVGPGAAEALESYVALQWAEFAFKSTVFLGVLICLGLWARHIVKLCSTGKDRTSAEGGE